MSGFRKPIKVKLSSDANKYFASLDDKIKKKFFVSFDKLEAGFKGDWFKPLKDGIWEFRQRDAQKFYRIYAFWDKTEETETLVIGSHGHDKKTNKTPKSEIDKAIKIRDNYFKYKNKKK
jgi:phage-related protein